MLDQSMNTWREDAPGCIICRALEAATRATNLTECEQDAAPRRNTPCSSLEDHLPSAMDGIRGGARDLEQHGIGEPVINKLNGRGGRACGNLGESGVPGATENGIEGQRELKDDRALVRSVALGDGRRIQCDECAGLQQLLQLGQRRLAVVEVGQGVVGAERQVLVEQVLGGLQLEIAAYLAQRGTLLCARGQRGDGHQVLDEARAILRSQLRPHQVCQLPGMAWMYARQIHEIDVALVGCCRTGSHLTLLGGRDTYLGRCRAPRVEELQTP